MAQSLNNPRPLRIAFPDPKKERKLSKPFHELLADSGLIITESKQAPGLYDVSTATGDVSGVQLIYRRTEDMPVLMQQGAIDLAVLGRNVIDEFNCQARLDGRALAVRPRDQLDISPCRLVLAVPDARRDEISAPADLLALKPAGAERLRIATSYPATLGVWLAEHGIRHDDVDIVTLSGGIEESIMLGAADIICDITQTGSALKQAGLAECFPIAAPSNATIAFRRGEWDQRGLDYDTALAIAERLVAAASSVVGALPMLDMAEDAPMPMIRAEDVSALMPAAA